MNSAGRLFPSPTCSMSPGDWNGSLVFWRSKTLQYSCITYICTVCSVKNKKETVMDSIWCSKTNICTNNSECIFLSFCYFDTFDAWIQECLHWNASCLWQFGKRNMSVVSQQFLCSLTCFVFLKYWRMFTSWLLLQSDSLTHSIDSSAVWILHSWSSCASCCQL